MILEDLPAIPLWYNGMWSQYNTSVWTNFPAAGTKAQFTPTVWNGYLNMTGIDALASLRLKKTLARTRSPHALGRAALARERRPGPGHP